MGWEIEVWVRKGAYVTSAHVLLGADVVVDHLEEKLGFIGDEMDQVLEVGFAKACG